MSSSLGMMTFPIYGQIQNVPNHQPEKMWWIAIPRRIMNHEKWSLSRRVWLFLLVSECSIWTMPTCREMRAMSCHWTNPNMWDVSSFSVPNVLAVRDVKLRQRFALGHWGVTAPDPLPIRSEQPSNGNGHRSHVSGVSGAGCWCRTMGNVPPRKCLSRDGWLSDQLTATSTGDYHCKGGMYMGILQFHEYVEYQNIWNIMK